MADCRATIRLERNNDNAIIAAQVSPGLLVAAAGRQELEWINGLPPVWFH
jgi:hypothetical protein